MKLLNFELEDPVSTICLSALGDSWDLHNFPDFNGMIFNPKMGVLILEWILSKASDMHGWGNQRNDVKSCRLIFKKLNYLYVTRADDGMPSKESLTLRFMAKVDPDATGYRYRQEWKTDHFRLLFDFHNDRKIEIGSETVKFEIATMPVLKW